MENKGKLLFGLGIIVLLTAVALSFAHQVDSYYIYIVFGVVMVLGQSYQIRQLEKMVAPEERPNFKVWFGLAASGILIGTVLKITHLPYASLVYSGSFVVGVVVQMVYRQQLRNILSAREEYQ